MGKPILLVRFEGPLQSWGHRARWDVRDSALEPTKSGIIGVLAAALGYRREDERIARLSDAVQIGIRVEQEPGLLDDYHTISAFFPTGAGEFKASGDKRSKQLSRLERDPDAEPYTIQSTRRYLVDAGYLIAIQSTATDDGLIGECSQALQVPQWPLFLGRRACVPTRPMFDSLSMEYQDVEDALRRHPWSFLGMGGRSRSTKPSRVRMITEASAGAPRDDRRLPGAARLYGRRWVREVFIELAAPTAQAT